MLSLKQQIKIANNLHQRAKKNLYNICLDEDLLYKFLVIQSRINKWKYSSGSMLSRFQKHILRRNNSVTNRFVNELEEIRCRVESLLLRPPKTVNSIIEIVNNLTSVNNCYEVDYHNDFLAFISSEIILDDPSKDIYNCNFGKFVIQIRIRKDQNSFIFHARAITPHYPYEENGIQSNSGNTHPHIDSYNNICLGNSGPSIYSALYRGHILEAMGMVDQLLMTYNPISPFRRLKYWDPKICEICLNKKPEVCRGGFCRLCNRLLCSNASCIKQCQNCRKHVCTYCIQHCWRQRCNNILCPQCFILGVDCYDHVTRKNKKD